MKVHAPAVWEKLDMGMAIVVNQLKSGYWRPKIKLSHLGRDLELEV
jgi:hypothetical protein